jgi:hypothetical protein
MLECWDESLRIFFSSCEITGCESSVPVETVIPAAVVTAEVYAGLWASVWTQVSQHSHEKLTQNEDYNLAYLTLTTTEPELTKNKF